MLKTDGEGAWRKEWYRRWWKGATGCPKKTTFLKFQDRKSIWKNGQFWTMSDNFGHLRDHFLHFAPFWTVLNRFGLLRTILDRLDYFGPCWTVKTVLDHLGSFWTVCRRWWWMSRCRWRSHSQKPSHLLNEKLESAPIEEHAHLFCQGSSEILWLLCIRWKKIRTYTERDKVDDAERGKEEGRNYNSVLTLWMLFWIFLIWNR